MDIEVEIEIEEMDAPTECEVCESMFDASDPENFKTAPFRLWCGVCGERQSIEYEVKWQER